MKIIKMWLSILVISSLATGCAMTVERTPLNYRPPANLENVSHGRHMSSLTVGKIDDSRGEENPRLIVHKQNNYGTTSGGYEAEKEITSIIKDGISEALQAQGYPIVSGKSHYVLNGELLSYDQTYVMGFWDCKITGKMELKLALLNQENNRVVWQDIISGKGVYVNKAFFPNDHLIISTIFNKTLDDVIHKLSNSIEFKQVLLKG